MHTHTTKAELHIITKHTIICAVCVCLSQVLKKEGTVTPAANFCANGDAAVLEKAIKTKGGLWDSYFEALQRVWTRLGSALFVRCCKSCDTLCWQTRTGTVNTVTVEWKVWLLSLFGPAHWNYSEVKYPRLLQETVETLSSFFSSRKQHHIKWHCYILINIGLIYLHCTVTSCVYYHSFTDDTAGGDCPV